MPGVAVIAASTWQVFNAKKMLKVDWDESQASKDNSKEAAARLSKRQGARQIRHCRQGQCGCRVFERGQNGGSFLFLPFLRHATLEPQNTTAWFHDGVMEIWSPTQAPTRGLNQVAAMLKLPPEKVVVHATRVGGGFGRRGTNDAMCEAAAIAMRVKAPVKLVWMREDDQAHDFHRVAGFHSFKGAVDTSGKLSAWQDHFITFTPDGEKPISGGGLPAAEFPANVMTNVRVTQSMMPLKIPCGSWRAPGSNGYAFAIESFIHELALAAGRDHLEFRLEMLGDPRWLEEGNQRALHTGRAAGVIKLAAEKAGWGKEPAQGQRPGARLPFLPSGPCRRSGGDQRGREQEADGAQGHGGGRCRSDREHERRRRPVQGSVLDGLSTMFGQAVDIENGRIKQTNFDTYPLMRMRSAPPVEVHFIQSDFRPTGLGEPALPPLAAAVCNGIFTATGERIRQLPLSRQGYSI